MNRIMPSAAIALALASALIAEPAMAGGVSAGSLIANTATASFDQAGVTTTVQSNTVTIRVDELLDVAVASLGSGATTVSSATAALPFRVTNTGNGDETYALTATGAVPGNGFDATVQGIALDSNGNGTYDAGVDQLLTAGAATPVIAADGALTAFVLVTLPAGTADAATGQVRLTATASTGSGAPGTIFAGAGTGGGDAVVGASTASANALAAVVASSSAVTLTKSATVLDPFGTQRPVPGATVTYTLVARVAGSGSAANLHVTDTVPVGTTYRAGTLTLDGTALSDAADGDAGQAGSNGIDVALGSVAGGVTRTVTFKVSIN